MPVWLFHGAPLGCVNCVRVMNASIDLTAVLLILTVIRIFDVYLIKSVWIKNGRFLAVFGAYCCLSATINGYLVIARWNR